MSLNFLPKEIENIIIEDKNSIEHSIKYSKVMEELKIFHKKRMTEYTCGWNDHIWELWCYQGHMTTVYEISLKYGYNIIPYHDNY